MDKPLWGLRVQAPFGARVLSFVCYAPNDGFGPQSGLVQRVVLYAAAWGGKPSIGLRSGGRRLAVRTTMEHLSVLCPVHPFTSSGHFPSRGNEGYEALDIVSHMTQTANPVTFLRPLGEEGHKVAKGVQANWIHRGAPRPANPVRAPSSEVGVDGGNPDYDTRCGRDRRRLSKGEAAFFT